MGFPNKLQLLGRHFVRVFTCILSFPTNAAPSICPIKILSHATKGLPRETRTTSPKPTRSSLSAASLTSRSRLYYNPSQASLLRYHPLIQIAGPYSPTIKAIRAWRIASARATTPVATTTAATQAPGKIAPAAEPATAHPLAAQTNTPPHHKTLASQMIHTSLAPTNPIAIHHTTSLLLLSNPSSTLPSFISPASSPTCSKAALRTSTCGLLTIY